MIVFIVVATVSLVSAATTQAPGHCCGPRKYTATLMELGVTRITKSGTITMANTMIKMTYDYDRQMSHIMASELKMETMQRINTSMIYDYKNAKTYVLPADGHCYTQYLDPTLLLDPCGSPNFTINGMYKIGSASAPTSVYQVDGMYGSYQMSLTSTVDDCTPVTQVLYGETEDKSSEGLYSFLYTDVQKDVVDETLFAVPNICSNPTNVPIGKRHLEDLTGVRVPF